MTTQTENDIRLDNFGSIIGITPLTQAGRDWIDENVQSEGWQWLGGTLNIEPRMAVAVVTGMEADGLAIEKL